MPTTNDSTTPQQIDMLRRFAEQQTENWEVVERLGHHFAHLVLKVTDDYIWHLQLLPGTPEESPYPAETHPRWKAECQKGVEADPTKRWGTRIECSSWLGERIKEYRRERQVADEVEDFARGRRHWNFYDQGQGRYYAGRRFVYPTGEEFLLSVLPHAPSRRRDRFRAQLNMGFAAGPEHTAIEDTIEDIAAWVRDWDKTLQVPLTLADCDRPDDARELVDKMTGRQVTNLAYLLGIPGNVAKMRRTLLERFAPAVAGGKVAP